MTQIRIIGFQWKTLFFFMCLIRFAVSSEIEIKAKFVKDYFQDRNVRQIVSFGCFNEDGKKLTKVCLVNLIIHYNCI